MENAKTLLLIRHAKSSWNSVGLSDHDRPLNGRGTKDAPRMVRRLILRGVRPEQIVSSSATRALTTAKVFASELGLEAEGLVVRKELYGAGPERVLRLIHDLDDGYDCVAFFGHNPTFSELAGELSGGRVGHMPTCAIVTLEIDGGSWTDVGVGPTRLLDLDFPKKQAG